MKNAQAVDDSEIMLNSWPVDKGTAGVDEQTRESHAKMSLDSLEVGQVSIAPIQQTMSAPD